MEPHVRIFRDRVEQMVGARGGVDPRREVRTDFRVEIEQPAVEPAQGGGQRVLARA
jgi:hypothetical protein